jgi:hypothetical protein
MLLFVSCIPHKCVDIFGENVRASGLVRLSRENGIRKVLTDEPGARSILVQQRDLNPGPTVLIFASSLVEIFARVAQW